MRPSNPAHDITRVVIIGSESSGTTTLARALAEHYRTMWVPEYGRMYQLPVAERIRYEAEIPVIAVGAIQGADHANTIIAAGRADLCALARPHLADPYWTLHAAAQLGYGDAPWPVQYLSGKQQLERNLARAAQMANERPEANG